MKLEKDINLFEVELSLSEIIESKLEKDKKVTVLVCDENNVGSLGKELYSFDEILMDDSNLYKSAALIGAQRHYEKLIELFKKIGAPEFAKHIAEQYPAKIIAFLYENKKITVKLHDKEKIMNNFL